MSIAEAVLNELDGLPPDRQKEVLDFVRFLRQAHPTRSHRRELEGLWADLGVDISAEEIDAARREMWGNFPRDDI